MYNVHHKDKSKVISTCTTSGASLEILGILHAKLHNSSVVTQPDPYNQMVY